MSNFRAARNVEPSFFDRVASTLGLGGASTAEGPTEDVNEWLDVTLKKVLGFTEIERDDDGDGDIPITYGSTVVFISEEVVPGLVELEVAVPRSRPVVW